MLTVFFVTQSYSVVQASPAYSMHVAILLPQLPDHWVYTYTLKAALIYNTAAVYVASAPG